MVGRVVNVTERTKFGPKPFIDGPRGSSVRDPGQPGGRCTVPPSATCLPVLISENTRADDGIRTRDPHLGKVMLYQLSHVRVRHTP